MEGWWRPVLVAAAVGVALALLLPSVTAGPLGASATPGGPADPHPAPGADRASAFDLDQGPAFAAQSSISGALSSGPTPRLPTPAWVDRGSAVSHLPASFGMLAYDAALSELVEFEGPFGATWVYAGGAWTNATTSPAPPPRAYGGLAYDAAAGEVILFGGISPTGEALNDTWAFDGGIWKNVTPAHSPPARFAAGFAADPGDGGVALVGGAVRIGPNQTFANDTWVFRSATGWTAASPTSAPPGLIGATLAYDPSTGNDVLFGGVGTTGPDVVPQHDWFSNQTWVLGSGQWTNATTSVAPSPREFPAMTADVEAGSALVLFGGQAPGNSSAVYLNDTWTFNAGTWTPRTPALPVPAGRVSAGFAWDAAASRAILAGGLYGNSSTPDRLRVDSWSYHGGAWSTVSPSFAPPPRFGPGSASGQGSQGSVRLFGGLTGRTTATNDTWSLANEAWQYDATSSAPPAVGFPAMAQDPTAGEQVLFGGRTPSGATLNDTWTYSAGWVNRTSASSPPARFGASLVYDATISGAILFGGLTGANVSLNDTWSYSAGTWTKLAPTRSPPARAFAAAVWDPVDSGVLLFGGSSSGTTLGAADLNDTWLFAGGNWTKLTPTASPAGRIGAALTFDSRRSAPVLFGGWSTAGTGSMFNDTWFLPGGASSPWVQIPAHAAPAAGGFGVGWWDGASNATWLYGGAALNRSSLSVDVSAKTYALDLLSTTTNLSGSGGPTPYVLNFSALSDRGEAPYHDTWSLGGTSESGPAGSFTINTAGAFTLYLNVTDAWGVFERLSFQITTTPGPLRVSFTASALNGTAPLNVEFHATAGGGSPPYAYQWDFGDGSATISGPSPNASHEFVRNLTFNVTLTVSGTSGPSGTWVENVSLHSLARFDVSAQVSPTSGTFPLNVSFSATTRNGTGPFHFVWSFGDGEGTTRASGSHEFVAAGNYTVRLNATDTNGSLVERTFEVRVSGSSIGTPTGSGASPFVVPWWVWGVAVGLVVLAIVAVVSRRRRVRPPGAPGPGAPSAFSTTGRRSLPPPRPPPWDEDES